MLATIWLAVKISQKSAEAVNKENIEIVIVNQGNTEVIDMVETNNQVPVESTKMRNLERHLNYPGSQHKGKKPSASKQ